MSIGRGNEDDGTSLVHLQNEINVINERIREIIINKRNLKNKLMNLLVKKKIYKILLTTLKFK